MMPRRLRRMYRGESIRCLEELCKQYHATAEMPNGTQHNYYQSNGTGTVTISIPTSRALELAIINDMVVKLTAANSDLLDVVEMVSAHPNDAVKSAFEQLMTVYKLSKTL